MKTQKLHIVALIMPIIVFSIFILHPRPQVSVGAVSNSGILSNLAITPGVTNSDITQANIAQTICSNSWTTKSIRPSTSYTNKLKATQIKEYGYAQTDPSLYEEDHYIALIDGGHPTDPKNLWPMPYPMAREKDKYEVYVHRQICSGEITLAEGQNRLKTDWYKWYQQAGLDKKVGATNDMIDNDDN